MYTEKHKEVVVAVVAVCVVAVATSWYLYSGNFSAPYSAQEASINPYADKPVANISGTVVKAGGSSITLSVYQPSTASRTVTAHISAGTKIFTMIPKDSTPGSPLPYTEKAIPVSGLQAGDSVIVAVPPGTKLGASDIDAVSVGVLP